MKKDGHILFSGGGGSGGTGLEPRPELEYARGAGKADPLGDFYTCPNGRRVSALEYAEMNHVPTEALRSARTGRWPLAYIARGTFSDLIDVKNRVEGKIECHFPKLEGWVGIDVEVKVES